MKNIDWDSDEKNWRDFFAKASLLIETIHTKFQTWTFSSYHVPVRPNKPRKREAMGIAELIETSSETLIEEMQSGTWKNLFSQLPKKELFCWCQWAKFI